MIRCRFEPARRGTVIGCGAANRVAGRAGDVIELDIERKVGDRLYVDYLVETIPGLDGERCLIPVVEDQVEAPPAPPPPPRVEAPVVPPAPAAPEVAPKKRARKTKAADAPADTAPAVEDEEGDDEDEDAGPAPAAPEVA